MSQIVRYDAMVNAIAAAYTVDEVKEIHDKALAAEIYARQAKNFEAERQVCEIRLRAERKAGQILSTMEKARGAIEPGTNRGTTHFPNGSASRTLEQMGISHKQSHSWQRLAAVPEEEFEAALSGPKKPSTTGIVKSSSVTPKKQERVDDDVLWLWGTLRDFERHNILSKSAGDIINRTPSFMREEMLRLVPIVGEWLREYENERS